VVRVLEDGSLRRVGSHQERRVNVRLIAATNRDLSEMASDGSFREDLYYRINVLTIELPPLRDRTGDVPRLIKHILGSNWTITDEARAALEGYNWPGNVRQLINVLERATILAENHRIEINDLPGEVARPVRQDRSTAPQTSYQKLEDLERAHVVQILRQQSGNKAQAARSLGIHRRKLYRLLERFNIQPEEIRPPFSNIQRSERKTP
jgi:DNA-binding NtrC family response regulator